MLVDALKDHEAELVVQYTEDYAHNDFILGFNSREVMYDPLISFFNFQWVVL